MNHSNQVEVPKEYVETSVKTLFKKFAKQRDVSLVYGDPIEVGLMKVVPVAKVSYGFGGGGDGAGNEGGGGSFKINPIGVYEITPESATFKPVRNNSSLAGIIISILSFGLFIYVRKMSTKKSR
ncbi:spore germination protein GerW family protein [Sporosarcina oncorhynchi]|uniref:Spore germination protein GerW family protein n=1 Tax=Sporosarcina oncorhynchi TaxID=3056444 RepID=A0ABZ0L9N4_9BACL|nr:spore germination protein GerW family protein [Sporosarcina sp. T2O-4]WOV89243.1 spore germination protein GerW family protein [Sporosarcina sp. T2O-4]